MPALTAIFACGIFAAGYLKARFEVFYFTGALFLIFQAAFFKRKNIFIACLCVSIFALGAAALKNSKFLSKDHISNFAYYKNNLIYTLSGVVKSEPAQTGAQSRFLIEAVSAGYGRVKYNCRGLALVKLNYAHRLSYGDEVVLTGTLYRPHKSTEAFSYRDYLARQGVYCLMNARLVKVKGRRFSLTRVSLFIKDKIGKIISDNLSPEAAGIMLAMVLGEKKGVPAPVNNIMVKTGTVHILVVSGFNVGIVAFISMLFLKVLRITRRPRQALTILLLILYCLMTGSSNPVMRATVMGVFFLTAFLLEREPDIYNALSLAALFILAINPGQLSDIGFQLSFASVIAIVYIYPKLSALFKIEKLKLKMIKFIAQGLLISLSAWLGTAGFIAYYFKIICPVTVLANILVVPLATLITLCGFSLAFAGLVLPGFAPYLGALGECAIALLLRFNAWAACLPGAYFYLGA